MNAFKLFLTFATFLFAGTAFAGTAGVPPMELPIISGGMFAITAISLATGVYVARNKHKE